MKRLLDCIAAIVLLLILWLPICLLLVITKYHFKESPIFKQTRVGKDNQLFAIYKIKTMRTILRGDGATMSDAARLTTYGRFLRATSLDELLQLWNVLKGDLSFVGPRPLLPEYQSSYTAEQNRRHKVMPGITGWAQVNGRNNISWDRKFQLDIWYVDHHSLQMDAKIILLTVMRVFRREGITKSGHATTEKFNEFVTQNIEGEQV
ncbi:sugar transferase [Listeria booriae]|uniref:Sugar transferase n=1 Tax=Listeria booriae TaxID=1552123 RepID=A0A7X1DQT9_9LIST|nr:sugar transferase [Listeria booriae]MBC2371800.1 sugar transferase [Listeria booriae]